MQHNDRNPRPGYDTLLLRLIQGDLYSAFPHGHFHQLPSQVALSKSYPNAWVPSREAVCTIFMMVFDMTLKNVSVKSITDDIQITEYSNCVEKFNSLICECDHSNHEILESCTIF